MSECGPSRSVLRVELRQFEVVFNCGTVLSAGSAKLCKLVKVSNVHNIILDVVCSTSCLHRSQGLSDATVGET